VKNKLFYILFFVFVCILQNLQVSFADDLKYMDYYNNAVTLFKANKYSSSILEFKKVLRIKPYDETVKNALVTAYLARAQHYTNQQQNQKAVIDLKNALYYLKYWNSDNLSEKELSMINSVQKSLKEIEKTNYIPPKRFQLAKFLRTQGELNAAGYEFAQLFDDATYGKKALENAADIYKTLNNDLDAINSYRLAIQKDSKNALLHFKYAMLLDEIGNLDAANDEYNIALKLGENNSELLDRLEELWLARTIENPKDASAYANLGTVLQKKGDILNAKNQYLKALAINPNDETVNLNLASVYTSENNHLEAIKLYDAILVKKPNNLDVLTYKAVAYEKLNNYQEALKNYKTILNIDPNNKIAKVAVEDIVKNNFKGEELYNYLETVANTKPNNFTAQYECAYELHKGGELQRAIQYYDRALKINPKNTESYINLAQIYSSLNNQAKYIETIETGLKNAPNDKKLLGLKDAINKETSANLYNEANKLWENKKYQEALNIYLKIPVQTPEVISSIALCYSELKDNNKALEYALKALQKNPNDTTMMYIVATSNLEQGNAKVAQEYVEKILSITPDHNEAQEILTYINQSNINKTLNKGIQLYEQKDFHNAILTLDEVTKNDSKNAFAYYYKGLIYQEQGKKYESTIQFQRVINLDPNFTLAYYSLASLQDEQEKYQEAVKNYDKFLELKRKEGAQDDEYSKYVKARNKELKEYLKLNEKTN